jgi:hypothetical protein
MDTCALRDSVTRFFTSGFFHESVSPQPQSIPLRPFKFFRKFAEIFENEKYQRYQRHWRQISPLFFASVVDTGGEFATGVNDTGGKLATGVNGTGGKQWDQLSNC